MRQRPRLGLFGVLSLSASVLVSGQGRAGAPAPPSAANPPRLALAERIAHTDPARYRPSPRCTAAQAQVNFFALFNGECHRREPLVPAPRRHPAEIRHRAALPQLLRGDVRHPRRRGAVHRSTDARRR